MSVLGPSFAKQIKQSRGLYKVLKPIADMYSNLAGYRSHGLKYDDILIEENAVVQKALGRLTERESYDRAYRHRVASMCAIAHAPLPKKDWIPKEAVSSAFRLPSRTHTPSDALADDPYPSPSLASIFLLFTTSFDYPLAIRPRRTPPLHSTATSPKPQDVRYLQPIVTEVEAENTERAFWDNVVVDKSKKH
ncbi:hypothetical protein RQP46_009094 [Phenoliferia psychrophenolica]